MVIGFIFGLAHQTSTSTCPGPYSARDQGEKKKKIQPTLRGICSLNGLSLLSRNKQKMFAELFDTNYIDAIDPGSEEVILV